MSDVNAVSIEYSSDGGSTWTEIDDFVSAITGSLAWTVPSAPSTTCIVRINDLGSAATDESDGAFWILAAPSVTVTAPNGGETLVGGESYSIAWEYTTVASIKIEYSTDNGSTWTTIISSLNPSSGSYSWTIPELYSTTCLVQITDTSDALVTDLSDDVFSIYESGIWGDVDDNDDVNVIDAQLISTYEIDPLNAVVLANESTIEQRGDVNASTVVDITDALICATYGIDPDHAFLPPRVGQPIGSVAKSSIPEALAQNVTGIPYFITSTAANGRYIIDSSFELQHSLVSIGAVSVRFTWDSTSLRYIGIDAMTEMTFINDSRSANGEMLIARLSVEGENPFRLPELIFENIDNGSLPEIDVEILTASTAGQFQPISFDDQYRLEMNPTAIGPATFTLLQNMPNPFNSSTTISFTIDDPEHVSLTIFNINGQIVKRLINDSLHAGLHMVAWDGRNDQGLDVGTGAYIYQLRVDSRREYKQMLLLR